MFCIGEHQISFLKSAFCCVFVACDFNFVRCASLLEDEAMADAVPVLNPVYAFDGQHETVTILCVPEDENLPKRPQTYEWRTVSDIVIVSRANDIRVDADKGVLELRDVTAQDSGQYSCAAIFDNEDKIVFVHNVIVVLVPKYVMEGLLVIAEGGRCAASDDKEQQESLRRGSLYLKEAHFCPDPDAECLYDVNMKYVQQGNMCLQVMLFTRFLPQSYQSVNNCEDVVCQKNDIEDYFAKTDAKTGKALWEFLGEDWSEASKDHVPYQDVLVAKCPTGYRSFDDICCVPCHPGTMLNVSADGELYCARCPNNSVSSAYGQTKCSPCPSSDFASDDQTVCIDKRAGTISETSNPYERLLKRVNMTFILEQAQEVKGYFGIKTTKGLNSYLNKFGLSRVQLIIATVFLAIIGLFLACGIMSTVCRLK